VLLTRLYGNCTFLPLRSPKTPNVPLNALVAHLPFFRCKLVDFHYVVLRIDIVSL